ncbi:hypothetical protein V5O48_011462 [Marasmius crinis-equi]|uniref:Uncharacterized protein n=1 Tax=Marasmius crinis-equi TaxID=585013 RepID=A0ABR3F5I9_9AGAR
MVLDVIVHDDLNDAAGTTEVTFPPPGPWRLGIFAPTQSTSTEGTSSQQEIQVGARQGNDSGWTTSSQGSSTTSSGGTQEPPVIRPSSATNTFASSSDSVTTNTAKSGTTNTIDRSNTSGGTQETLASQSGSVTGTFTSTSGGVNTNTNSSATPNADKVATQTLVESATQTESTTQTSAPPNSRPGSRPGPIIGGILGGLLGVVAIISALWFYYRHKHRHQNRVHAHQSDPSDLSEFNINSFPPGRDAKTRQSRLLSEKSPLTTPSPPLQNVSPDIDGTSSAIDADTRVPPPIALLVPDETTGGQDRSGIMAGLTTNELVLELNQRMQDDGQWNDSETLPGYPGSEREGS